VPPLKKAAVEVYSRLHLPCPKRVEKYNLRLPFLFSLLIIGKAYLPVNFSTLISLQRVRHKQILIPHCFMIFPYAK